MSGDSESLNFLVATFFTGLAYVWFRCSRAKRSPWPSAVVYMLSGWPIVVNLADPRSVVYDRSSGVATVDVTAWSSALQVPAWTITSLLLTYLVTRLLAASRTGVPRAGLGLLGSFLLFASTPILSGVFGDPGGGLTHALVRPHLVFACIYLAANEQPQTFIRAAKLACMAYVAGSLVAALGAPGWAFAESASISGGPLAMPRLYGVASNPNALAPVALIYLYLEYIAPSRQAVRLMSSASALVVILMAQSKTIWGAAIVSGVVLLSARRPKSSGRAATARRVLLWASLSVVVVVAAVLVDSRRDEISRYTLTGRTVLWSIALEEWRQRPLIGYGPTLWDEQFRSMKLGEDAVYAGHAHNMYLQQLAESGAIGFALMLVFLTGLAAAARRSSEASKGLSMALYAFVLLRCATESALSLRSLDESMFVGAVTFGMFIVMGLRVPRASGTGDRCLRSLGRALVPSGEEQRDPGLSRTSVEAATQRCHVAMRATGAHRMGDRLWRPHDLWRSRRSDDWRVAMELGK